MGRPAPASYARRRRGETGGGARGDRGEPADGFGAREGGRTGAGHGALLQAATAGDDGSTPAALGGGDRTRELPWG